MWNMLWPVLVVVGANTLYNISTKSTPAEIDPFASLAVTYLVSAVCALIMFFITNKAHALGAELSKANWTTYALGVAVVGLEFGFLSIYRAGWKISTAHLVASVALSCVLLLVGLLAYKESISARQIIGIVVCAVGLVLIAK